jgi:mono/diheme cytochrome c family protein
MDASPETVQHGKVLYHRYCGNCHGNSAIGGGVLSDLRYSSMHSVWDKVVLEGSLHTRGMVSFSQVLTKEESTAIQAYVIERAHRDKASLEATK